jgi:hypothetical protein
MREKCCPIYLYNQLFKADPDFRPHLVSAPYTIGPISTCPDRPKTSGGMDSAASENTFPSLLSPSRFRFLNETHKRRFFKGRMFDPDMGHIHHRLIKLGLTAHRAVMAIYGVSVTLCITSILLVNLRSDMASLLLIVLGAGVFIIIRKLGYLEYFAIDKLYGWFRDVSDEAGLSSNPDERQERRR